MTTATRRVIYTNRCSAKYRACTECLSKGRYGEICLRPIKAARKDAFFSFFLLPGAAAQPASLAIGAPTQAAGVPGAAAMWIAPTGMPAARAGGGGGGCTSCGCVDYHSMRREPSAILIAKVRKGQATFLLLCALYHYNNERTTTTIEKLQALSIRGYVSTTGVHKSENKEVCGEPTAEARARARDGSRSRWGALAEAEQGEGEAGSGLGRRPLPCQCGAGAIAPVCCVGKLNSKQAGIEIACTAAQPPPWHAWRSQRLGRGAAVRLPYAAVWAQRLQKILQVPNCGSRDPYTPACSVIVVLMSSPALAATAYRSTNCLGLLWCSLL
jgi:hypothetical protein